MGDVGLVRVGPGAPSSAALRFRGRGGPRGARPRLTPPGPADALTMAERGSAV